MFGLVDTFSVLAAEASLAPLSFCSNRSGLRPFVLRASAQLCPLPGAIVLPPGLLLALLASRAAAATRPPRRGPCSRSCDIRRLRAASRSICWRRSVHRRQVTLVVPPLPARAWRCPLGTRLAAAPVVPIRQHEPHRRREGGAHHSCSGCGSGSGHGRASWPGLGGRRSECWHPSSGKQQLCTASQAVTAAKRCAARR